MQTFINSVIQRIHTLLEIANEAKPSECIDGYILALEDVLAIIYEDILTETDVQYETAKYKRIMGIKK